MDEITSKGRGRPRKVLAVPNAVAEGENAPNDNAGNGQAGPDGANTPSDSVGQGAGWDAFVARVIAAHDSSGWAVRIAYHPKPEQEIIVHENGSIVVHSGQEAVMFRDGERKSI